MLFEKKFLKKEILEKLGKTRTKKFVTRTDIFKSYGDYRYPKEDELKIRACKVCKTKFQPAKKNHIVCPKCYKEYEYAYMAKGRYNFLQQQVKGSRNFTIVFCERCSDPYIIPKAHFKLKSHICRGCIETRARDKRIAVNKKTRKKLLNDIGYKCDECGNDELAILQVHHKDRNGSNNSKKNLQVLCPNCHRREHSNLK